MRWKVGPWDGLWCDWLTGQGLLPCASWAAVEGVGLQGALADLESKGLILSWSSTADLFPHSYFLHLAVPRPAV